MKPLTDREAVLFVQSFALAIHAGKSRMIAVVDAKFAVDQMRLVTDPMANAPVQEGSEAHRAIVMAQQIVDPPPALFCWDGAKPTFKRVGPVEICERCQQSPADHFGTRPKSG